MSGILAKQEPPSLWRRKAVSSRWRRTIVFLLMVFAFLSALTVTSKQIGRVCYGNSCGMFGLREILPKFAPDPANSNHGENMVDDQDPIQDHNMAEDAKASIRSDDECAHFPDTSNVLILMKTGASEAYSRLPVHLLTMLKCLPNNFLLFSDMAENIAGHTVYDSLEHVLDSVKESNGDFHIYHRQNQCPIAHEQCNWDHDVGFEGWNLDKYKNVHIAERAYKMRPNYDWYFFIDADTYVSFPTLMDWLPSVDPNKLHYIGHQKHSGTFPFAHGGSGYLMSKAIMRSMFFGRTGVANKYDEPTQQGCCGDIMWSEIVLNETGLTPENMWPAINEFKPRTFSYYEDQWCQPIITLHHVNGEEINDLYAFEKEQKFAHRITIKDVYNQFVASHLQEVQPDWDNESEDVYYLDREAREYEESELDKAKKEDLSDEEREAHKSHSDCRAACEAQEDCFQWRYRKGICGLNYRKFKHGTSVKREDDDSQRAFSGWDMKRIKKWINEQGDCDGPYQWRVQDNKE